MLTALAPLVALVAGLNDDQMIALACVGGFAIACLVTLLLNPLIDAALAWLMLDAPDSLEEVDLDRADRIGKAVGSRS